MMSYLDAVPNLGAQPSLKQLAYETLQRQIINGQLQPGSRLTEEELSRSMSISRAPIREALNMLERDGFTKIIPRRGAVVTDVSRQDVINIWEVRALLEPYAARCSVGLVPKEELERILARLDRMAETPEQFDNYTDLDLEIHALFHRYLDNSFLKSIVANNQIHSNRVRWIGCGRQLPNEIELRQLNYKEHRQIIVAMLSGVPDAVYEAVRQHVVKSGERVLLQIDASPPADS